MAEFTLGARLMRTAELVRAGAVFADIGTDHAYLPIFLIRSGKIKHAVLTDINAGPLASARENVTAAGVSDKCTLVLCDGASAISDMGVTDYSICGMGGELIARIITDAPHLKQKGVRLILQPMSRPAATRAVLASLGFEILSELYSREGDKYYLTILCEYTGKTGELGVVELELGAVYPHPCDKIEYFGYLEKQKRSLLRAALGKESAGESAAFERELISVIDKRLEEKGENP